MSEIKAVFLLDREQSGSDRSSQKTTWRRTLQIVIVADLCRDNHINEGTMGGVYSTISNENKCTYTLVIGTLEEKRTRGRT